MKTTVWREYFLFRQIQSEARPLLVERNFSSHAPHLMERGCCRGGNFIAAVGGACDSKIK
jgi:hypothetical protein